MIFSDLFPGVISKMGNRTDLVPAPWGTGTVDKISPWLKKSILELTSNYEFEELKATGPTLTFTIGQASYAKNYFTNGNEAWTSLDGWFLQLPSTTVGWEIKGRAVMVVDPLSKVSGPPVYWAQHGPLLILGFNPDQAYSTYWRYQKKHPFVELVSLPSQEIFMPDEWQDVLEYATAIRGAGDERGFDYVNQYRDMIYGDERYRNTDGQEGNPGLIFGLVSQQYRNKNKNERQLQPIVQRY